MSNSLTDTISTLNKLIETCLDGQEGFRLAAEAITDDEDLKGFLFSASLQRSKFAGELQNQVIELGEPAPLHTNSISSKLHRGWINIKTAVAGNDNHSILAECEKGEDSAVAEYRKALNSELPSPLSEIVSNQFQEVLATHNSVRGLRDQLASQKPAGSSLKAKGQAFSASASDGWASVSSKTDDVLHQTEIYVRENPFPAILTALGVGFALGLLVRLLETPSRDHIEVPIPKAAQKVRDFDYQAAVLPFLWPVVKFFSSSYAASRKSVNKAYKQASDIDVSDYIDPVVKKAKKFF